MPSWSTRDSYCWDSSVFFAWLKNESCHPLDSIAIVLDEIEKGDVNLIVPMTAYEELRYERLDDEQKRLLDGFLERSNVMLADLSPPVSDEAAEVRRRSEDANVLTKPADSRIAATAIVYGAAVLHTLDDGLLRLNRSTVVRDLPICKPKPLSGQRALPHGMPDRVS